MALFKLVQATRRLYRPPGQNLSLGQVVELNKRFIIGYEKYKDEPRVAALKEKVAQYNRLLDYMGLRDHQVMLRVHMLHLFALTLVHRSMALNAQSGGL